MKKFHEYPNRFVTEIVLKVEDLKRSLDFYKDIIGFKVLDRKEKEVTLSADGSTPLVTLIQPEDVIKKIPRRSGLYHFALLLPDRLHLGLFLKNINDKNYPIIGGSNHGVSEAIYLQDPDDNGIEVYTDIDSSKWTWKGNQVEMVTEPLDYKGLLEETGDNKWNGISKETIIGHIHLHVDDLDKAREFYIKGLGFDEVMEMGSSALFLSSGGYHHHIGLNTWNGRGAEPLPQNSAGMKYYTIKLPSKDTINDAMDRLRKLGFNVMEEDDHFYAKDPSGNFIRLVE